MTANSSHDVSIDINEARDFLYLLDPNTNRFTFQTLDDNSSRQDPNLLGIFHGTLHEHAGELKRLSGLGAGVFVTVNETNLKGRKAEDITRVRAYFADMDGAPLSNLSAISAAPHIKVESSPGRYHAYWLVEDAPADSDRFAATQEALIEKLGSDPKVKDLPRVMRLPGFPHQKGLPFISRIIEVNDLPPYKDEGMPRLNGSGGRKVYPEDWETDVCEGEGRNNKIASLYGSALNNMERDNARRLVSSYNQEFCKPPLTDREFDNVIASITRKHERDKAAKPKPNGAAGKEEKKPEVLNTIRFSEIPLKAVKWLWKERIAQAKLTVFAGPPGQSKSLLTLYLAARISKGDDLPCGEGRAPLGNVIIMSAEDDPGDTIGPRLQAAGADVSKIHHVVMVSEPSGEGKRSFDLTKDIPLLKKRVDEIGDVKLIVIDPISAYFGTKLDTHKDAHVRAVLMPLKELAEATGAAIIAVMHLNKSNSKDAMTRVSGSIGFTGAARGAYLIIKDPSHEEQEWDEKYDDDIKRVPRLFVPIKNNVGDDYTGLTYELEEVVVEMPRPKYEGLTAREIRAQEILRRGQDPIKQPRLVWLGEVRVSANQALSPREAKGNVVAEWLQEFLSDGPKSSNDVKKAGLEKGYSWDKLKRGKDKLNIKATKGGFGSGWQWELPGEAKPSETTREPGYNG